MANFLNQKASMRARLAKLMDSWGLTSQKIERKKARAAYMGAPGGMQPSLFGKFRKLLDQIAFFADKERDIISEINEVEKKHRILRQRKLLKRVEPEQTPRFRKNDFAKEEERRRRNRLWWIIIFLIIMFANRRREKKNEKTALRAG
ncbi:MAG: hypothetical protein PHY92_01870 [Alphaproteobacteria bacterium]|nr:hypothetical protein [Alphaproteobacteria bacterium]